MPFYTEDKGVEINFYVKEYNVDTVWSWRAIDTVSGPYIIGANIDEEAKWTSFTTNDIPCTINTLYCLSSSHSNDAYDKWVSPEVTTDFTITLQRAWAVLIPGNSSYASRLRFIYVHVEPCLYECVL